MEDLRDYVSWGIKQQMLHKPDLGVCVVFNDNIIHSWNCIKLADSDFAEQRINHLIDNRKYSDFEKEFLIINDMGEVLFSNCEYDVVLDQNGYIHIDASSYLIKPVLEGKIPQYIGGKSLEEINEKARVLIAKGLMSKPKNFDKKGFKPSPIYTNSQMES